MAPRFQAPKGTLDIFPGADIDSRAFEALVGTFAAEAGRAGFGLYAGPIFEDLGLYERLGATSDIVGKEMYDFEDKGGRKVALRPDSTPSAVRVFAQHRPPTPWKVWYLAPHFRYDRPQAGRYRQHHSLGVEAFGSEEADVDVEVIALFDRVMRLAGLTRYRLLVNSIGDDACRPAYRAELQAYLGERRDQLCPEHQGNVEANPLRVLDCKRDACIEVTKGAPRLLDRLCDPCAAHFARLQEGLAAVGLDAEVDTRLVRGQDYYVRTTFEFESQALEGAQLALGGGGRYDGFVEAVGGPPTAAIGFGIGVERVLLAQQAEGIGVPERRPQVFVIDTLDGRAARDLVIGLRASGVAAERAYGGRSFNGQLKAALKSGADLGVVVEESGWTLRTLHDKGEPESVPADITAAIDHIRKRLDQP